MHRLPNFAGRVVSGAAFIVIALLAAPASAQDPAVDPAAAFTPAQAYAKGCGGCHRSERMILRTIPKRPEAERLAWIEAFMAGHPCEFDAGKPKIAQYLLEKTRR